jgi:aminoglycoside 2'-N-acetyltransferase I
MSAGPDEAQSEQAATTERVRLATHLRARRLKRTKLAATPAVPITVTCERTEDLDAATRAAIVDLCVRAHQEDDFRNLFAYIPGGGLHFLACQDGQVISHAVVTTRWLQPDGHRLMKTAYVDAVATLPAWQGQGYGSAVMRFLARNLAGYSIACLETERPSFFGRFGWEPWRGALAGRDANGLIPTPEQRGVMILRLPQTPALDLDSALVIESQPNRVW